MNVGSLESKTRSNERWNFLSTKFLEATVEIISSGAKDSSRFESFYYLNYYLNNV